MDLATLTPRRAMHLTAAQTLTLLVATPLLFVACTEVAENADCPNPCGTAVVVTTGGLSTVVTTFASFSAEYAAGDLIFLKLAEIGPERQTFGHEGFEPRLARSWEFEDERTIVFQIDPRARWHDGTPVTAEDVAFTFDVYRDTVVNVDLRNQLDAVDAVTVRDSNTVAFEFNRVYPEQFYDATYHMRILPAHLMDTIPRADLRTHALTREPVGNGPYEFERWLTAETPELVANADFFLGTPGLARVMWRIAPDPTTALSQVLAGDADIIELVSGLDAQDRARDEADVQLYPYTFPFYYYIAFNFRDPENPKLEHPLFKDPDVRRAITLALNREVVSKATFGEEGLVPPGPVSKMLTIWNDSLVIPHDTSEAFRLLETRGWSRGADGFYAKNGERLAFEITYPSSSGIRARAAVIIQEQLRQAGIDVTLDAIEFQAHFEAARQGKFDMTFGAWNNAPSPSGMRQTWTSGTSSNQGKYSNPDFDALVNSAMSAPTSDEARDFWNAAVATIVDDTPAIWLMTGPFPAAVSARFEDVTIRPEQWAMTLWEWRVRPGQTIPRDRVSLQ